MKISELGRRARPAPDFRELAAAAEVEFDRRRAGIAPESKPTEWSTRAKYSAALGSTALTPSGPDAGVECVIGRVWAEARSVTVSAGTSPVEVVLVASQNGVRARVKCDAGATITGGVIRFWNFDTDTQEWALTGVEEPLPTGAQIVSTSDQFTTVGGK